MATGDIVAEVVKIVPAKTFFPDGGVVEMTPAGAGGDPVDPYDVDDFDPTDEEYLYYLIRWLENYATTDVNVIHFWGSSITTASKKVRWEGSFRTLKDADDASPVDIDAAFNYETNRQGVSSDMPTTSYEGKIATIAFTSGAQLNSPAAGDWARYQLRRDTDHADDNMLADARLFATPVFVEA